MMEFILIEKIEFVDALVKRLIFVWLAIFLNACGVAELVPYGQPQANIRIVGYDEFEFSFRRDEVDSYGSDRNGAVEKYLQQHSWILPPNCGQGIKILRGGDTEAGGGWVLFKCK